MNKEITILELFNSYAKPIKQPRKIKYRNKIYVYDGNAVLGQLINEYKDNIIALLNDKVEIIEEDKKIEKLSRCSWQENGVTIQKMVDIDKVFDKVNELIDVVNELRK